MTALITIASNALFLFFKSILCEIISLMQVFRCTSAEIAERNIPTLVHVLLIAILKFQISILGHISHVNTV